MQRLLLYYPQISRATNFRAKNKSSEIYIIFHVRENQSNQFIKESQSVN